ncbi:MAG: hypothetical protein JWN02_425, partial [Acidobacteria bacterium]|nr:hypothetical protein [Acidobacteriota bacterium]
MMIDRGVSEGFPGLGDPERETNVSDLWSIVSKSRLLILFCAITGIIVGLAVAMFSEAQYKAVVSLNVERDAGRLFEITENSQGMVYDPGFLPTQTRLMKSREVAERVVARLGLLGNAEISPSRSGLFRVAGPSTTEAASSDLARAATRIQAGITATPITGTNLVELSYVGKS